MYPWQKHNRPPPSQKRAATGAGRWPRHGADRAGQGPLVQVTRPESAAVASSSWGVAVAGEHRCQGGWWDQRPHQHHEQGPRTRQASRLELFPWVKPLLTRRQQPFSPVPRRTGATELLRDRRPRRQAQQPSGLQGRHPGLPQPGTSPSPPWVSTRCGENTAKKRARKLYETSLEPRWLAS